MARIYIFTLVASILSLGVSAEAQTAAKGRPNIIVIMGDDIGYSDLGCFGSEIPTPNLDKLAKQGVRFTQFYNMARCCPSRAALLTGQYPHNAGVGHMIHKTDHPGYREQLTSNCVTIAELLGSNGYGTYMAGKWHLARAGQKSDKSDWPLQRGFQKYYGTLQGAGSYYDPATLCRGNTFITPLNDPEYHPKEYYYTDALADNSIAFLQQHKQDSPDKPFFLYLAFTAAHWPLHAPEDEVAKHKGRYDAGYDAIRQARLKRQKELGLLDHVTTPASTAGAWDKVENKDWEARCMEVFAAMITRMDTAIGRLVQHLSQSGQLDNTVIMFMQDNGGCAEDFGHESAKPVPKDPIKPLGPDDLQKAIWPPMQTRDGRPVRSGPGVMPGPADTYLSYWEHWANVSNTPFRFYKHFTHEGGIATPLIVHWPKGIPQPRRDAAVADPSHLIDILPTCAEIAGAAYPKTYNGNTLTPANGVSLVSAFNGKPVPRKQPIFWEHESNRAVRDGKWKLVSKEGSPWELYDMDVDRAETNDLAASLTERAQQMAKQWDDYARENNVLPLGGWKTRKGAKGALNLKQNGKLDGDEAPSIDDSGVSITALLDQKVSDGVIVAQGGLKQGYSLYIKDGMAHFAVRRNSEIKDLPGDAPIPTTGTVTISASLNRDGAATLAINTAESKMSFGGPLVSTPTEGLDVGTDSGAPVGEYHREFTYSGKIVSVQLEFFRATSQGSD